MPHVSPIIPCEKESEEGSRKHPLAAKAQEATRAMASKATASSFPRDAIMQLTPLWRNDEKLWG